MDLSTLYVCTYVHEQVKSLCAQHAASNLVNKTNELATSMGGKYHH